MRKILIVVAVIAVLVIAAALAVSPIAKSYILKHDKELTGRKLSIDKLRINIFTGSLSVENAVMYEADDKTPFASVGRFETAVRYLPLIQNKFVVTRTLVDRASVNITQRGSQFNFDDIIAHFAADSTEAKKPEEKSSWSVDLQNIDLKASQVMYKDLAIGADWGLENMTFHIPSVYFSDQSTDVGLDLELHNGGSLKSAIEYKMESGRYKLSVDLENFTVESLLPYAQQFMNVGTMTGRMSCNVVIDGDVDHVMDFNVSGTADVENFALNDKEQRKLVEAARMSADVERINLQQMIFAFNKLSADGIAASFDVFKEGKNNFSDLMCEPEPQAVEVKEPQGEAVPAMQLYIKELAVGNSSLHYSDNSLSTPFNYAVTGIEVSGANITPAQNNSIRATATLAGRGRADVVWQGNPSSLDNHDISVALHNVDLTAFTSFSLDMFGYPLTSGTLSFTSQNVIYDRNLNCMNKLDIHRCAVGKKDKTIKAEYNVPLKLGLYVLTDKRERIAMDIPVKGNLDSPEFSYRKIVIKTICNLLVKVAAAPFSFIAGGGDSNTIFFDIMQTELTPTQYDQLKELATAIKDKPELKLTFVQNIAASAAIEQMSVNMLKMSFLSRGKVTDVDYHTLGLLDKAAMDNMSLKDKSLVSYADSLISARRLKSASGTTAKAVALFSDKALEKINRTAEIRNGLIKSYFVTKEMLPDSSVVIRSQPADSLKTYKGKHKYSISVDMAGDDLKAE